MEEQFIVIPISALQTLLQEVQSLKDQIKLLEERQTEDNSNLHREIALDRQRISELEHPPKEPRKTELYRAEKIEKYLLARPDHKATFETLKGHLQVDNVRLNEAINILITISDRSYSIQKAKTGDKRKKTLFMLPR